MDWGMGQVDMSAPKGYRFSETSMAEETSQTGKNDADMAATTSDFMKGDKSASSNVPVK